MSEWIKEYIEKNIHLIDTKQWYILFTNWYLNIAIEDPEYESAHLDELFHVLREAGIEAEEQSYNARETLIFQMMSDYIETQLQEQSKESEIHFSDVVRSLHSRLDIRLVVLRDIFNKIASSLSNKYPIKLQSFTIHRLDVVD